MSRIYPFPEGHGPVRLSWDVPPKKRKRRRVVKKVKAKK